MFSLLQVWHTGLVSSHFFLRLLHAKQPLRLFLRPFNDEVVDDWVVQKGLFWVFFFDFAISLCLLSLEVAVASTRSGAVSAVQTKVTAIRRSYIHLGGVSLRLLLFSSPRCSFPAP